VSVQDQIATSISIYNSTFINNYSSKAGGIIYSMHKSTQEGVLFEYCTFSNNTSPTGKL